MSIKWARMAENARKFNKAKKAFEDAKYIMNSDLNALGVDAEKYGYTLWHTEKDTYFWENRYKQVSHYPTLAEAIVAYGTETIDFGS